MFNSLIPNIPSMEDLPFLTVVVVLTAGLTAIATLRLAARQRRCGPAAAKSAADDHAAGDHDLLWRALDAHAMVNVADADGRTVSVNNSFVQGTGYRRDEVVGRRLWDILFAPGTTDRDIVSRALREDGEWTGETVLTRKDGSRFWTRTTIVGLCDDTGNLVRTVAVRTDITKNKISQDAEQKRRLLERLRDEVYVYDAEDLTLLYLNQSALDLLGWTGNDYVGKTLADTNSDFDEAGFRARVVPLRNGKVDTLTYESIHQGRPVEINLQLDRGFDGRDRFIGVVRDITARKQAEAATAAFVATVSHELRAPLTSVLGALKLVTSGTLGTIDDKPFGVLGIALRNVERLVVTINDLLDLEKFEAGKMEMPLVPTDLSHVLEEAVTSNASYAAEHGVELHCTGTDRPQVVEANHDRLIQVLNNLLSNAAKFSEPGGTVETELRPAEDTVEILVRDHGVGIPPEFQDRLFERFAQAGAAGGRRKGSGLGLSISKAIVERHGGAIHFESEAGLGTTFCVVLPRRHALDGDGPHESVGDGGPRSGSAPNPALLDKGQTDLPL